MPGAEQKHASQKPMRARLHRFVVTAVVSAAEVEELRTAISSEHANELRDKLRP